MHIQYATCICTRHLKSSAVSNGRAAMVVAVITPGMVGHTPSIQHGSASCLWTMQRPILHTPMQKALPNSKGSLHTHSRSGFTFGSQAGHIQRNADVISGLSLALTPRGGLQGREI